MSTTPVIIATNSISPCVIANISFLSAIMVLVQRTSQPEMWGKNSELCSDPVIVGLGGNVGDVRQGMAEALRALAAVAPLHAVSHLYSSAPIGPQQPDFLNAAALVSYPGDLHLLLDELHRIEAQAGRTRAERWGPRTLDLDILWAGQRSVRSERLQVPHVELCKRAFAILPLLDLMPEAVDPRTGQPLHSALAAISAQGVERIAQDRWWEALPLF